MSRLAAIERGVVADALRAHVMAHGEVSDDPDDIASAASAVWDALGIGGDTPLLPLARLSVELDLDPDRVRTWLGSPDDSGEGTVSDALGIGADFGFGCGTWTESLEDLITAAATAGMFGDFWVQGVGLWLTYDPSQGFDGAVITVDLPDGGPRLASTHIALRHLSRDHTATGDEAVVALLTAVATEARGLLAQVRHPPAMPELTDDQRDRLTTLVYDVAMMMATESVNRDEQAAFLFHLGLSPAVINTAAGVPAAAEAEAES